MNNKEQMKIITNIMRGSPMNAFKCISAKVYNSTGR